MTDEQPQVIHRGSVNRDDGRLWHYWDCECCQKRVWYLNNSAMMKGSIAHRDEHKRANFHKERCICGKRFAVSSSSSCGDPSCSQK